MPGLLPCIAIAIHLVVKTTTLPPLRVTPRVRKAIEAVLEEGETLSAFMLGAIARQTEIRSEQRAFAARALARSLEVERTGQYIQGQAVFKRLEDAVRAKKTAASR